ncbi:Long-chain-fatty-acid--CoA ligase FadD13 [Pseudomonas fluorescens]|uniref:acyl-CoA synthetase n=1 Tax=Pseudomonas fluorescens TaxID=294 RepID=UPI00123F445D|nr:acyl-CoA synthetase [Pseudomonas fluorescens]VVQ10858.1 Long-chain-fatty-acid--CoA ligase FadD13 [Pseudomonas fluorescens]
MMGIDNVMNLGEMLNQIARRYPDAPGFIRSGREHSWKEISMRVDSVAAALRDRGIRKGDKLLVHSRNNLPLFESAWIAFRLGAVWVPTNVRVTPAEAAYLGSSSGAVAMLYDEGLEHYVDAVRAVSPSLQQVIAIGQPRDGELGYDQLLDEGRALHSAFRPAEVKYHDPLWFFYTSGTTGHPKAGVLTHGQMAFVITNHIADLMPGLNQHSRSLVLAPLSHGAGIHALVNVARGAACILPASDKLDCDEAWRLVQEYRVDNLFTVPTIVKMLTESDAVDRYDHSSLRHVIYAGAPMYRADQRHALNKLGKVLVQYYGLGEVTGSITVLPADCHESEDSPNAKTGSCGYPRTGMQVAILDDAGNELDTGMDGEICVRGPAVFSGYYNNPKANESCFKFGWFHTGDLGHLDEHGYLFITGRASDMYISGGSNVYPREIEEALLSHPAVTEAAVLGMPDAKWGESGYAVIVTTAEVSDEQLLAHLEPRIARYKWPKRFVRWDEMPKSGYGKIVKKQIRALLEERQEVA